MLLTLPAALALVAIPIPVISALFEHGEFTSSDTLDTAAALTVFACGLPAFVLIKVFSPGFFAREDTRTPMIFAAINAFVNITLSIVLFARIGLVGIAVATSTAAWINTILLASRLRQLGHFVPDHRVRSRLPRILLASIAMAAVLWALTGELEPLFDGTKWQRIGALGVLVTIGGFVFAVFVQLIGGARISEMIDALRGDKT
jgi:putative peptidoglycan lipid II flippase